MELKFLKGVGEKRAKAFSSLGINDVLDFLQMIPRYYLPRVQIRDYKNNIGKNVVTLGKVIDHQHPRKPGQPLTVFITDNTGSTETAMFGGRIDWRVRQFKKNDTYLFFGRIEEGYRAQYKISYRDHIKAEDETETDKKFFNLSFYPIYELPGELKETWVKPLLLTKIAFNALHRVFQNADTAVLKDIIPPDVKARNSIVNINSAYLNLHFPVTEADAEVARQRFAFEELFLLQLIMAYRKEALKAERQHRYLFNPEKIEEFKSKLPYKLTPSQNKVISEINNDLYSDRVMNRLLQGDVGSGKTVVAVIAMLTAALSGFQAAIMAPTEILARQHYKNIITLLQDTGIKCGLLLGAHTKSEREPVLKGFADGSINIAIGTHSLFQESVNFHKLSLIVIDEQHKFGVMQRAKLKSKGTSPDILIMSATPIPRTLSLAFYGDLDVSTIDEIPSGRQQVKTAVRTDDAREKIFDFVKKEISNGRQAYIVFPLIEENDKTQFKAIEKEFKNLKKDVFKDYTIEMIHGRMDANEKEEIMNRFVKNEIHILASTTVIEVGVDVPNASIMIIEDAQNFGLSQLHQLRGRVGRGAEQSYCILINSSNDPEAAARLQLLAEVSDGFKIAEADMKMRGPGEFYGLRQAGSINLRFADLNQHKDLLTAARKEAFEIIKNDKQLRDANHKNLNEALHILYNEAFDLLDIV